MTHMKRFDTPNMYPLHRDDGTYAVTPKGPHPADRSIPLGILLRDMLGTADTLDEAEHILHNDNVLVDGTPRRSPHYTVGFMDVITFTPVDEQYRFVITESGATLHEITDGDATSKLCKVTDKTTVKNGETQLNLHDGKNIVTEKDCRPGDTVHITLPDQDIEQVIPFEEGNTVYITGGKHRGNTAEIQEIREVRGSNPNLVTLEDETGTVFEITPEYLYVVGENQAAVEL